MQRTQDTRSSITLYDWNYAVSGDNKVKDRNVSEI